MSKTKRARKLKSRHELPPAVNEYFAVLEMRADIECLNEILAPGARITRDGKNYIEGRDAVRAQIAAWLASVEEPRITMTRMRAYEDGCAKVDFVAEVDILKGATLYPVRLPVIGMYELDEKKERIEDIFEYWARIPPLQAEWH